MDSIITIAREYASGGRVIAQKLADTLRIPYYDRQLIELAAKETGLSETYIEETEQKKTPSLLYNLYVNSKNLPVPDQVFVAQSAIIRRLASEGPCIILGRCADYVLRDHKNCLHVFLYAPLEDRVWRAREEYGESLDAARMMVAKNDRARASYYSHFTAGEWGKCDHYDICINSSLGVDRVVAAMMALL
ncbi:MAG: cytidylate kinase-like family protein [Clostridiales bacterium]|jgi:cytidylate kinase|nr:cytidylate kinase-like family protein [Clostridiales bacterium]